MTFNLVPLFGADARGISRSIAKISGFERCSPFHASFLCRVLTAGGAPRQVICYSHILRNVGVLIDYIARLDEQIV